MLPLACGAKLKEVKIVIEFRNVSKVYDSTDTHALNHVNIKIEDGEFVFVVGSSGAGKSTFLKVLAGKLEADAGTISRNPNVQVSLLEQNPPMEDDATVLEQVFLHFPKEFRELNEYEAKSMLNKLGLPDYEQKVGTLSGGQRKRVALAAALIHPADVLVLDEPVDGLDPVMRRQVWSLLLGDVADRGTTVLVSSHNLRELEDVCDHVGIMDHGHVLLERSLAQLQDNMVKLQVVFPDGMEDVPAELPVLHASKLGRVHTLIMRMNAQEATERLMAYSPLLVDAIPLTLEEIFIYELGGADYAVKDIVL